MSAREWVGAIAILVAGSAMGCFARSSPTGSTPVAPESPAKSAEMEDGTALPVVDYAGLLARARSAASSRPLNREAVTTLAILEDEFFHGLEAVGRLWERRRDDVALHQLFKDCVQKYKELIRVSDAAVTTFFRPEFIDGVPWRDLLADRSAWRLYADVPGFEFQLDEHRLRLEGPDAGEAGIGVVSVGDAVVWRDFVLDFDLTVHRGSVELFFRLPPVWQKNVESLELAGSGDVLEPGWRYEYQVSVIGSELVESDRSWLEPARSSIHWTQVRKGAFGFAVRAGAEIEFTKLRIKVLR